MDLEKILETLLTPDTLLIREATKELKQALKHIESIGCLYDIMTNHTKEEIRQYAALLLRKYLAISRNYQKLTLEMRQQIKIHLPRVIFIESKNTVRAFMIQFLGVVLRHEHQNDGAWTNEVLQLILNQCSLTENGNIEIASFVLSKLADFIPEQFLYRFYAFGALFLEALYAMIENSTSPSPAVSLNILTAIADIISVVQGCTEVEQAYETFLSPLAELMKKYAFEGQQDHFSACLEVLQNISEFTPYLLSEHLSTVLDLTFLISSNWTYDAEIRMKSLNLISILVTNERKLLVKLNLVEPMINVVFNVMAAEPEGDDPDEFFVESASETPLASANLILDAMASSLPPDKFLPPLLALLEPALKDSNNHLRRRAAYIVLATVSEGCRETIINKYLQSMLHVLKQGINDPVSSVRNAALFAVGQFSEQLQPEIANYATDVMPLLLKCMQDVMEKYHNEHRLEVKHSERVFYALEAFCSSIEDLLAPYLENLMNMILSLLTSEIPPRLTVLSLALSETLAEVSKGSLLPWFEQLMEKLRPMLVHNGMPDPHGLWPQAINTLAAIVRNVDKQFLAYAAETMEQSVNWIGQSDDIGECKSVINLFGALASVVGDDAASILPTILNHIFRYLDEGSDFSTPMSIAIQDAIGDSLLMDDDSNDGDAEINLLEENLLSDDDSFVNAKAQAILTVKELAECCMKAMLPYASDLFNRLLKATTHCSGDIRKSSILAAKTLVIQWFQTEPSGNAQQTVHTLLVKLDHIIREDNCFVVNEAQQSLSDILVHLGTHALTNKQISDAIAKCVKDGLTNNYMCLYDDITCREEEGRSKGYCEPEKAVVEEAANMITALAKAVPTDEFVRYFQLFEPLLLEHVDHDSEPNGYFVGVLADCFAILGSNLKEPYISNYVNIFSVLVRESNKKVRRNAVFGLGVLMRAGNFQSYRYIPEVLETLSEAIATEKERSVLENIVGALARLILVNASLVPLSSVIPTMLKHLPIEDDEDESVVVIESFYALYCNVPNFMEGFTGDIIVVAFRMLSTADWHQPLVDAIRQLIRKIRLLYPAIYEQILATFSTLIPLAQEVTSCP